MMLTICFVRRGFEGMIGRLCRLLLPLVSMSQRIESTNLIRCKLNLKLGGECVAGTKFRPVEGVLLLRYCGRGSVTTAATAKINHTGITLEMERS